MERYTPEERGIIVTDYLTNSRSVVLTQREFRRRFPRRPAPCARTIKRLAERLVQTGSTRDVARSGRPRIARSAENITAVAEDVRENPQLSTRQRCAQFGISRRSLNRILEDQEWEDFKTKFDKSYKDDEEEKMRRKLYVENKLKIEEHNKRFESGEITYSIGINAFADNTPEEHAIRCGTGVVKP